MSIIHDALKKAQAHLERSSKKKKNPNPPSPPKESTPISTSYPPNPHSRVPYPQKPSAPSNNRGPVKDKTAVPVTIALFLIAGVLLGGVYYFMKKSGSVPRYMTKKPKVSPPKREFKQGEIVLNGVTRIEGKMMALINDEIYQTGDSVQGMRIMNIELNKVELLDGKKTVSLTLR